MPPDPTRDASLIRTIERDLAAAEQQVASIYAARTKNAPTPEAAEARERALNAAIELRTALQRQLAAAQGLPYLIPCELPVRPCTGAPMPAILATGHRTILTFYCSEPAEPWDGTSVQVASPQERGPLIAVVTLTRCTAHKLAGPNDEVWHGHPLYCRGFEGYSIQQVVNSPWIAELEAINAVHTRYDPSRWRDRKHYIFWFHDETFECIAESLEVEITSDPMTTVISRIAQHLCG